MADALVYLARMRVWQVVAFVGVLSAGQGVRAESRCMYANQFYGPGASSCQQGVQKKCVDGRWEPTGAHCADQPADPTGEEAQPGVVQPPVGSD